MKKGLYVSCVKCHPNLRGAIKKIKAHKKEVYVRKIEEVRGFNVFAVRGEWIRKNICEDFVNFGQHLWFKFIPKNEFWVDAGYDDQEDRFYIAHLLVENKLLSEGKSCHIAFNKAIAAEKRERNRSSIVRRILKKLHGHRNRKELYKKVHKELLKKYSKNIKVWVVHGELVRDFFDDNFGGGGHGVVDPWTPVDEIWLDDDISPRERKFILLHEMHERRLMATQNLSYLEAHKSATKIEDFYRHHPRGIDKALMQEAEMQP